MNDICREKLIQKKTTGSDRAKKAGLIAAVVLLLLGGLFLMPILLLGALALGVAAYFLLQRLNVEYEYLYVNGDIDVDYIYNRSKRKKALSIAAADLDLLVPAGSHELDQYKQRQNVREWNFTSGEEGHSAVTGVYHTDGSVQLVTMELDRDMIDNLYRLAPRKVSRECLQAGFAC